MGKILPRILRSRLAVSWAQVGVTALGMLATAASATALWYAIEASTAIDKVRADADRKLAEAIAQERAEADRRVANARADADRRVAEVLTKTRVSYRRAKDEPYQPRLLPPVVPPSSPSQAQQTAPVSAPTPPPALKQAQQLELIQEVQPPLFLGPAMPAVLILQGIQKGVEEVFSGVKLSQM